VFSFTGPSAGLSAAVLAALALLLPIAVITILTACATAVALAAGKGRAERGRVDLGRLLDALCALCRCGRSRR
jgi:hypothetical protein